MRRPTYAREHETMVRLERHYLKTYTLAEAIIELEREGFPILAEAGRAKLAGDYKRAKVLAEEWEANR